MYETFSYMCRICIFLLIPLIRCFQENFQVEYTHTHTHTYIYIYSCGFAYQQRVLKAFPDPGYLRSEDGVVYDMYW